MTINAMTVSAGEAAKVLMAAWEAQRDHGMRMSFMLHGRPGIGKTQVVEQLADHIKGRLYDVRLTQIEVSDLRGLPYYDHETKTTKYYRPEELPADSEPAVLFLDEITAASPFLQPTVYGLLQERRVGSHKIPDNVIIVAAGNTVNDGAVAYEMPTATANRLVHMYVGVSAEDWLANFAVPKGIHPAVCAFIKIRPELLETSVECQKEGKMVAATPRSWERVSQIMYAIPDRRVRTVMIAGTVGDSVCADFMIVADDVAATVQVTEMVKLPRAERARMYPVNQYGLQAMVFGLLGHLQETNVEPSIEIMVDIGKLPKLRPEENKELSKLPLMELRTHGMESLIAKAMEMKLESAVLDCAAYNEYHKERESLGLNG
jgi:uncharacterized protein YjeT (DUF2065 family)